MMKIIIAIVVGLVRGRGKEEALMKNEVKLRNWTVANNYDILSGPEHAFYEAPFMPGFLRRNEIHFRVVAPQSEPNISTQN